MTAQTAEREGMAWFVTYSGRRFFPFDPHPADVELVDIAHALSLVCRFGGHCARFYSVAQHSVLVSHLVAPSIALHGLMHDAAEAYVGDVIRPIKRELPGFDHLERRVSMAIEERFQLRKLEWSERQALKAADNIALVTERRDLVSPHVWKWNEDELGVVADRAPIVPLTPGDACAAFRQRFVELATAAPEGLPR